ncbi:non-ribosomal peptide synthetase [Luteimonas abyssi]|uniref:non-ribosomal peptide synthetase n=1 Tax=Luteimonas abyssi TaxID=1247514 RepID=UPI000737CE33|nr:non-ribosomal peptide synthetase [Luteimonas abyssi]
MGETPSRLPVARPAGTSLAASWSTPVPLTEAQAGLWYAQRLAPDNPAFNTAHALWIEGALDVDAFVDAADRAAAEASALALRMRETAQGPRQWLDPAHRPRLDVVDLSADADPDAAARVAMARDRGTPVDPTRDRLALQRLYRVGGERWVWYLRVHHLATDGYGMALLTDRVCALYAQSRLAVSVGDGEGVPAVVAVPSAGERLASLDGVFAEDAAYRSAERRETDAAYWRETLSGMPAAAGLGGGHAPAAHDCVRHVEPLDRGFRDSLMRAASALGHPWPDVLTALTAAYCRRFGGQGEAVVGVPYMGRLGSASARVPAMVMNVLPLRVPAMAEADPATFVRTIVKALVRGRRHGRYRGEQLRRDLGLIGGQRRLHGPLINVQPFYRPPSVTGAQAVLEILGTGPVDDATFGFRGDGTAVLDLEIEANPALYRPDDVAAHAARLRAFLAAAFDLAVRPDACLDDVPLATPDEARRALFDLNATAHPVPDTTLAALIESTMAASPDAPAVAFAGQVLSYRELDARSRALAQALRARGAGRDARVAVALPRSLALVVALVAVSRAGAAYLPLDASHPPARRARILDAAQPVVLLADDDGVDWPVDVPRLPSHDWPTHPTPAPLPPVEGGDAAYVIYTSGSTGEPKGVVVEHRAIVNRLLWMRDHYGIDADDRILQKTPATFDVSVWEFFLPLLAGATLVVAPPDAHRDPAAVARLIREAGITTLHFVPSMLAAFLAAPDAQGLAVDRVFVSGEALDADLRDRFHATLRAELHNLYGPTEAAVDVSYWAADADDTSRSVPIGFPVWNTRLYVLDARLRPLPPGVAGDLYLGGVQLARGYLGRDDLTAARFIDDPHLPGERLYRTGDLARYRADGAVEFLGRSDHQVKLRGLRIELGEIEAAMLGSGQARQAAAIVREDRAGDRRLVGYVQPVPGFVADALRAHVAATVPDYMVPAAIVALDDWPLTANGKLDREALPAPAFEADAVVAPRTPTEAALAALFAQALGVTRVGADADFFALGGDSLSAVHLLLAVQQRFGRDPGLGALFATPTVAALAAILDAGADTAPDHGLAPVIPLTGGHGAPGAPLFAVHPAGGIAWCYRELARALAPARRVYGLQSPALDLAQALPGSIDVLAAEYAKRVVALQPAGPVHLLGWSVGGILAQAMAVRLRALGREVGVLALLDAYPAECWRAEPEPDAIAALRALLAIAGYDPQRYPELRTREAIVDFLRRGDSALGNLPAAVLDGVVRAVTDTNRLVRLHRHARYDGTLLHVRAANDHVDRPHLQAALWQPHAAQVEAVDVPFLHAELTGRDATARIAPLLERRLAPFARSAAPD